MRAELGGDLADGDKGTRREQKKRLHQGWGRARIWVESHLNFFSGLASRLTPGRKTFPPLLQMQIREKPENKEKPRSPLVPSGLGVREALRSCRGVVAPVPDPAGRACLFSFPALGAVRGCSVVIPAPASVVHR